MRAPDEARAPRARSRAGRRGRRSRAGRRRPTRCSTTAVGGPAARCGSDDHRVVAVRLRGGDDRVRDLPRAAARRRPRRRRGVRTEHLLRETRGRDFSRARLSPALCLPHALSPARPPPSTSRSSQWCAPWWRGPRRWGRCRRSRRRSRGRSSTGSASSRAGSARRARRARPGSGRAWCARARTGSGSAGGCWWCRLGRRRLRCSSAPLGRHGGGLVRGRRSGRRERRDRAAVRRPRPRTARRRGGLQFTSGRTWEFPTVAAAARFVRRWAPHGDADAASCAGSCPAAPTRRRPTRPTRRAARTASRGGASGSRLGDQASAARPRRRGRGPPDRARRARHLVRPRRRRDAPGRLGVVLGALERHDAGAGRARGHAPSTAAPVELRRARRRAHARRRSRRRARSARSPTSAARLRGAPLEPRRPRAPARGRGVARPDRPGQPPRARRRRRDAAACGSPPTDWHDRVRALAARLDADGAVDVRVLRVRLDAERRSAPTAALGAGFGGGYDRTRGGHATCSRAWSLRAGGALAGARGLRPGVTDPPAAYIVT